MYWPTKQELSGFFFFFNITCLFLTVLGLCCSVQAYHCSDFSCGAQALGSGLSSLQLQAPELQAQLWHLGLVAPNMQDLPKPGIKPMSSALLEVDSATEPPGKPKGMSFPFLWLCGID